MESKLFKVKPENEEEQIKLDEIFNDWVYLQQKTQDKIPSSNLYSKKTYED
jgi:hypothetical protein